MVLSVESEGRVRTPNTPAGANSAYPIGERAEPQASTDSELELEIAGTGASRTRAEQHSKVARARVVTRARMIGTEGEVTSPELQRPSPAMRRRTRI